MSKEVGLDGVPDGPEVFVALITPLGAPTDDLVDRLETELMRYNYQPQHIRLSELLAHAYGIQVSERRDKRINELIELGNRACRELNDRAAVAALGVRRIVELRGERPYLPRTAWIIRSLKRPEEVKLLQQTYGAAFYALALYSEEKSRRDRLRARIQASRSACMVEDANTIASEMIERDEKEALAVNGSSYGQNVLKTFPMADVILPVDDEAELERATRHFIRALFGENEPANSAEHAMCLAETTAALSSSLSRKVGACVTNKQGEIVAVGVNEVPKAGGGQYVAGITGGRDADRGNDYSEVSLHSLAASTVLALASGGWLSEEMARRAQDDPDRLADEAIALLEGQKSPLMSIVEFQRSVHAEMGAILDAGRRGVSAAGGELYTTTYPCHLCMKELIAAGIQRVIYIEPYPKSRAEAMYGDSIAVPNAAGSHDGNVSTVKVVPFVGVAPRAYRRLFDTEERYRRKNSRGEVIRQSPRQAVPKAGDRWLQLNLADRESQGIELVATLGRDERKAV